MRQSDLLREVFHRLQESITVFKKMRDEDGDRAEGTLHRLRQTRDKVLAAYRAAIVDEQAHITSLEQYLAEFGPKDLFERDDEEE